jgi:integrase
MQGAIYKYDGKRGVSWYYVIDIGRDAQGKRLQKFRRGFKTKKLAEEAMRLELHQRRDGSYIEISKETVGELLDRWLTTVARHKIKASSYEDYERVIRLHLKPQLGHINVQALTPAMVQAHYSERIDAGVGARTVRLCHLRLSQALALAEREGSVRRNVCTLVDPPRDNPKPGATWTAEEARRFLAEAKSNLLHPFWLLALTTGMRRGELLGLRWQDVDLQAGTLTVVQSVAVVNGVPVIQTPKSEASNRKIPLTRPTVDALAEHRRAWVERKLAASEWDGDLVFCTRHGKPINPHNIYRYFNQLIANADVPRIRFHDLRHTHATLLVADGTPIKAVSERLGHSKTSITLDTYAHALPAMQEYAVAAIDRALSESPEKRSESTPLANR